MAMISGQFIGKWAFIPVVISVWILFIFFIKRYGGSDRTKKWVQPVNGKLGWKVAAVVVAIIPLPLFLYHYKLLAPLHIWLPWILIALINPFLEEFYWRGLLLDYLSDQTAWVAILFSSFVFSANHIAFGINSEVVSGADTLASTVVMGLVWGTVYHKTKSLRWTITSHFFVDFFNVSSVAFLDLFEKYAF